MPSRRPPAEGNVRPHPTASRRRPSTREADGRPEASRRPAIGRPRLLSDETMSTIVGALRLGSTIRDAAALAGVSEQAVHNWKARGANALEDAGFIPGQELDADEALAAIPETEHIFVEFVWRMASIDAERHVALLGKIAGASDWRAQAWLLKHAYPERYGDRLDVGLTVDVEEADTAALIRARMDRLREQSIDTTAEETG